MNLSKKLRMYWMCQMLERHDWTNAMEQGIKPTTEQMTGGLPGFLDFSKMYCARCGKVSEASKRYHLGTWEGGQNWGSKPDLEQGKSSHNSPQTGR